MRDPRLFELADLLRQGALADGQLAERAAPIREARLFRHVLREMPIAIDPGDALAGDFGPRCGPDELRDRMGDASTAAAPSPLTDADVLAQQFQCRAGYCLAHTCADYERVIEVGLGGILDDVRAHLGGATGEARDMLLAMEIALSAVAEWAGRYATLAREMAAGETDADLRAGLIAIADACEHVPLRPARSFSEAAQAVWLVHAAIGVSELSDSSLSLGRLDQFMHPLYVADLERGVSREQLRDVLRDLWRKLNAFGDPACAVNLGGVDADGEDLYNPLSELIVDVTREMREPSPILAARIHDGLPGSAWEQLLDPDLFAMGQPTFYGEAPCREAMLRRGVPEDQVHRFALNSCMGLVMPGEEISDMWGAVFNLLLPLELAVNNGRPLAGELPLALSTTPVASHDCFDDLYDQHAQYMDEVAAHLVARNRQAAERVARDRPNPFLSALTRDCVERGKDRAGGGARYHSVIVEGFGWCNAADALTAIRELVFEARRHSLGDLVEAAKADFAGHEEMLAEVLRCPKFGNGDARADMMARRVTDTFASSVSRHSEGNVSYLPSYHTLTQHVGAGKALGASLDGRRAGEPLGKNVGPMLGRSREGLTGVILSASAIDQAALGGGQALDVSVDACLINGDLRGKFKAALLTYFERGGLQVQVNGVTADVLREAITAPELHGEVLVRIAGYSAPFVSLPIDVQHEMVERLEQGL